MEQCASPRCFDDRPYMCPDGACRGSMVECKYPFNISVVKKYNVIKNDRRSQAYVLRGQDNQRVASAFAHGYINFDIKGMSLSQVKDTRTDVSSSYDSVYLTLFSKRVDDTLPREFIRSTIVDVDFSSLPMMSRDGEDRGSSLVIVFKANKFSTKTMYGKYKSKRLFCLAVLRSGVWSCVSRKYDNGVRKDKRDSGRNEFSYGIHESGTYAVIFAPDMPVVDFAEDEFCGILCKDKKKVFSYIFFGIPTFLTLFYVLYKL